MSPPAALDVEGPAAPPRRNGELVFAEPWQSRAFGLAMALDAGGAITWTAFREELIVTIAESGREDSFDYYRCWLLALERVVVSNGLAQESELESSRQRLAARADGHEHHAHP